MQGKFFIGTAALSIAITGQPLAQAQKNDATTPGEQVKIEPLTVGDPARPIEIAHWLKGKQVEQWEDGQVYVLEFWATWCVQCRASIPHLSELQDKFKDYNVTFIGVSDEPVQDVVKFLAESADNDRSPKETNLWFDAAEYTLAADPDRSAHRDYMQAVGLKIPCAFIIGKDQRIEWIGRPMYIDKPLAEVVNGTWNRQEFMTQWEQNQAARRAIDKAMTELHQATAVKDWDRALKILDELIAENDGDPGFQMHKFMLLLKDMEQPEKAYAFGGKFIEENWTNPIALNMIAWYIVDEPDLPKRDLELAMKAATQANGITDENNPAILDTLARVYYEKKELMSAVRLQRKAAAIEAPDAKMAAEIKKTLEKYERELNAND